MANQPPKGQPNRPETFLSPSERAQQQRLFSAVEEFPHKFIAWLDDHLKVNIPQFPVTQIKGFQTFQNMIEQFSNFINLNTWEFIDAKGDMIAGVANDLFTIVPVGTDGQVLIADSGEQGGVRWGAQSASATGQRELQMVMPESVAVSSMTAITIGISTLLAGAGTLTGVRAFVAVDGSSNTVVDLTGGATLSTSLTIPSGDNWDDGNAVIDDDAISTEDLIRIVVTSAGTGAKGLGVILTFG